MDRLHPDRPRPGAALVPGEFVADPLTDIEKQLVDFYQRDFPLVERPFLDMAERLGAAEADVIEAIRRLEERGVVSRLGAVIAPHRAGCSTLAAMAVPNERLDEVAALISAYREVNHNYEREHAFNLWFVVTARTEDRVREVLAEIATTSGLDVLDLPLESAYHIDLGFPIRWT